MFEISGKLLLATMLELEAVQAGSEAPKGIDLSVLAQVGGDYVVGTISMHIEQAREFINFYSSLQSVRLVDVLIEPIDEGGEEA